MKYLVLVRHGEAESAAVGQQDFTRALTARGMQEATETAQRIQHSQTLPNIIICSTAKRAHSTASLIANALNLNDAQLITHNGIYSAGLAELLQIIQTAPDCERLMLVGHNPTISELSDRLAHNQRVPNLPTCGMVSMAFDIATWEQLLTHSGLQVRVDLPRKLR